MSVRNAIAIGGVTFHWTRARDESKYAEHHVEESTNSEGEEANTTCTNEVATASAKASEAQLPIQGI